MFFSGEDGTDGGEDSQSFPWERPSGSSRKIWRRQTSARRNPHRSQPDALSISSGSKSDAGTYIIVSIRLAGKAGKRLFLRCKGFTRQGIGLSISVDITSQRDYETDESLDLPAVTCSIDRESRRQNLKMSGYEAVLSHMSFIVQQQSSRNRGEHEACSTFRGIPPMRASIEGPNVRSPNCDQLGIGNCSLSTPGLPIRHHITGRQQAATKEA
jgi:hypothetical protein